MVGAAKRVFWRLVAWLLSAATALIRRQPERLSASQWRAVQFSYSHYGEDRVIFHILRQHPADGPRGIYVDVGAFDPALASNTLLLHQHGWTGINIDANPDRIAQFQRQRPADISLCAAVSDRPRELLYLHYPTPGTNRLVEPDDVDRKNVRGEDPIRTDAVRARTIMDLLTPHLTEGIRIDFLNIDCEGEDLRVLAGFDWRLSPRIVAVEAYDDADRQKVRALLQDHGYTQVAQCILTLIFVKTAAPLSDLRVFA